MARLREDRRPAGLPVPRFSRSVGLVRNPVRGKIQRAAGCARRTHRCNDIPLFAARSLAVTSMLIYPGRYSSCGTLGLVSEDLRAEISSATWQPWRPVSWLLHRRGLCVRQRMSRMSTRHRRCCCCCCSRLTARSYDAAAPADSSLLTRSSPQTSLTDLTFECHESPRL